ncbi:GntR family transcriptional regulator [Solirubrobacter ginsenosidimutans]|uniref:GntR family transcriptional regulator n=1 Tax=Solirubrobacter ginsenosidimutans TaxID=490573 RepID=A0A9X3S342_9ACTN|nr:GntR family transcriptional regulator [Solirubrobacter ginsenosidimutans]MDA0165300.1 GntR family transcriptional regulator [Solirubrobacter ginsenosidimutans]
MAPTPKPKNLTKQERVYREVRERILSGAYGPGYRVVIDSLAEEFEVSALPVREAIRRLEAEGLVIYRPNAGAQVAPAEPGVFDEEMTVLAILEGYATALAAPELTAADIEQLTEINERMIRAMEQMDSLTFGRLNQEFHALIHQRCPNAALVSMLHDVARRLDAIRRTVFIQIPYRGAESVSEHRGLIELLSAGAPSDAIEAAARQHKLHTVESFRAWQKEHA